MIDFPPVHFLKNVLLIRQIRNGGAALIFQFDVRVANKVVVARLPSLAVGAQQRHSRPANNRWSRFLGFRYKVFKKVDRFSQTFK